jgi:hypothetical protein
MALLHATRGDVSAASQTEIRCGSRPDLPDKAGVRRHRREAGILPPSFIADECVPRPRGSTVLMGNSLAEMLSTLSWLAHYGFWVNRHTLRVEFTYESRMRSLGIQALEGARMKSFLRTG